MASSGWQGQKDIQTSKYPHVALNLNVWNVTHIGTTLTFNATVKVVSMSGWISYNGASVGVTGASAIGANLNLSSGQSTDIGTFSCTVTGVAASTTSLQVAATLSAGSVASGTGYWTIYFDSSTPPTPTGEVPQGPFLSYNWSTWNSVNTTFGVSRWGTGASGGTLGPTIVVGSSEADFNTITSSNWRSKGYHEYGYNTSSTSAQMTLSTNNAWYNNNSPLDIKGMRKYYLAISAYNSYGNSRAIDMTVRYLPPAPPQFTYTDPGGTGTKTYQISFVGDTTSNNSSTYNQNYLTRTVRYRIDSSDWIYIDNATVAAVDFITNFNITLPADSTASVEGWMEYHGEKSEVFAFSISNTNNPVHLYGSVNAQSEEVVHLYGSVRGRSKKIKKLYASVGGVTKKVFEDV